MSDEIGRRLVAEGHVRVNFAIVGRGPNAASPHHEPGDAGDRRRRGGAVRLRRHDARRVRGRLLLGHHPLRRRSAPTAGRCRAHEVLESAQAAAVAAATVGTAASAVDAVAREALADGGFAGRCIHRVGHGIGVEAHEEPYLVEGNDVPLARRRGVLDRAGHLPAGGVGPAPRGHRGRRPTTARGRSTRPTAASPSSSADHPPPPPPCCRPSPPPLSPPTSEMPESEIVWQPEIPTVRGVGSGGSAGAVGYWGGEGAPLASPG